jgi:hypothetical protein
VEAPDREGDGAKDFYPERDRALIRVKAFPRCSICGSSYGQMPVLTNLLEHGLVRSREVVVRTELALRGVAACRNNKLISNTYSGLSTMQLHQGSPGYERCNRSTCSGLCNLDDIVNGVEASVYVKVWEKKALSAPRASEPEHRLKANGAWITRHPLETASTTVKRTRFSAKQILRS